MLNVWKFMHAQQNVLTFVGKPTEKAEQSRKSIFLGFSGAYFREYTLPNTVSTGIHRYAMWD